MKKTPIYLINLEGQGDVITYLVDQEIWDWVTCLDPGIPEGYDHSKTYSWPDRLVHPVCPR